MVVIDENSDDDDDCDYDDDGNFKSDYDCRDKNGKDC